MNITDNAAKMALVKRLVEAKHISFDETLLLLGDGDTIKDTVYVPYTYPNLRWWTPSFQQDPVIICQGNGNNTISGITGQPVSTNTLRVAYLNADT